jgi:hypothetical protein
MNKLFKIVSILAIIGQTSCLFAQESSWKNRLYTEGSIHYGFVLPHSSSIAYFVNEHVTGFQLNIGLMTNGVKQWQQFYNYPRMGFGFYHSGLGNDEVYGKVNALYFYFDRMFINNKRHINFGNRISFGLGYINKRFDLENNYYDVAIGSKLNVYINYSLEGTIRIVPKLQMKLGLGFSHMSNGRFFEPNKGLNLITSLVGIQYAFSDPLQYLLPKQQDNFTDKKNQVIVMGAWGQKQISRRFHDRYSVEALSGEYAHKISRTSWLGLSLNTYYDPSIKKELAMDSVKSSTSDLIRVSINLSYELSMGKVSYILQPGWYLKNSYTTPGIWSNRIGIRYKINEHLLAGITIKAHWLAIADFIEWGIGYKFDY